VKISFLNNHIEKPIFLIEIYYLYISIKISSLFLCSLPYKSISYSTFHQYNQENINPQTHHKYHSTFTPNHSRRNSSSNTFRIGSKIIYDETCLSNKQYNKRVAAFIDHIDEKFNTKIDQISNEHKSSRPCTYQVSTGHIIQLYLHIAVNGASKSMRGQLPLSNLNLNNGDFGDDAGMFIENRDFCFIGKLK